MPYWRQIDSNGAFVKGEGINQDTPPGPNYVQANYRSEWLGGDSLFNMPESVEVKVAKEAARKMSLNDGERNREIQVKTENVLRQFADGRVLPPQPDEKPDPLQDPIKQGPNTIRAYKTADGSEVWRLLEGTTWTAPAVAAQARSFEQEKILRGIPTSSSSFGVSELGPVAAQLRREEAEATVEAARVKAVQDLRVNNAAILKGEEETAIAKRNEAFAIDKDGYARSVDNVKLQREAQSELFKQQNEVARLTAEQVGLVARRDESQASLDQAVNLANLSAEQRGKEFNVTQEFNVQRANEEAARARQQQLQTLGTDIGKLGADSGDRGKYAATILANSGWGQVDRALSGTNMNTTASLSPLESLLRQREAVQNLSDKPYTYTPTTISTAARTQMGPVDFSRMQMPTLQPLAAFTSPGRYTPTTQTTVQVPNAAPASIGAGTAAPSAPSAQSAQSAPSEGSSAPMPSSGAAANPYSGMGSAVDFYPDDIVRTDAGYKPFNLDSIPTPRPNRPTYAEQDAAARANLYREQLAGRYGGGADEGDMGINVNYGNSSAASGEAYGTKGTKEREFITGDPQRNGKPNPELVRVNNPGPNTRVEVIPLQGNGDMNMTSMYANGTDTGLMTADGRKRGPLEVLQYLLTKGANPQSALDMVNALGFDPATGDWKSSNKASEPIPTGPASLFTEGATEGNVRAKIAPKSGVDEGDMGIDVKYPVQNNDEGDMGIERTDKAYLNRNKRLTYKEQDELARQRLAQEQSENVDRTPRKAAARSMYDDLDDAARASLYREQLAGRYGRRKNDEGDMGIDVAYAYGTKGAGAEGAGDGLNVIMAALQNNPAALAAFMALIGQGQEAPSFPA